MTFEEFLPIYSQIKKEKEVGAYEDFMEGLKVYDKAENGTMLAGELAHVLLSLGESLVSAISPFKGSAPILLLSPY